MKRSFIIRNASDDLPPNEGEGALHIRGGDIMKQFDLKVLKQNGVDCISYSMVADDVYDEMVLDKIKGFSNIIPFQYNNNEVGAAIVSYANFNMTLDMYIEKVLDKKDVLTIMSGILSAFEVSQSGVPISYLVKDIRHIYVDEITGTVKFILIPIKQEAMSLADIPSLFREVLSKAKYSDADKDNYVAAMLTILNSNDFSLAKLRAFLEKQLETLGYYYNKDLGLKGLTEKGSEEVTAADNVKLAEGDGHNVPEAVEVGVNAATTAMPTVEANRLENNINSILEDTAGVGETEEIKDDLLMLENMRIESGNRGIQGSIMRQLNVKPVPHIIRKRTGEVINITKSDFKIGKSKVQADYTIENNSAISRVHCVIVQHDGVNYIVDNNSTNRTYLNGVLIEPGKEMLLRNRTTIRMGDEEFTFLLRKGD